MNIYALLIIFFLIFVYAVRTIADYLNVKNISQNIPEEFRDYYDRAKYAKSQEYLREKTRFCVNCATFFILAQIIFITAGKTVRGCLC